MSRQSIAAGVAGLLLSAAAGGVQAAADDIALSVNIGTLGPGVALSYQFDDRFAARLGLNRWSRSDEVEADGIRYDFELDLDTKFALLDWRPAAGTFRVSGGLVSNGNSIAGSAPTRGVVNIGGNDYDLSQAGELRSELDFDSSAPYLGIGWDWLRPADGKRGFGASLDLGVLFQGSPSVELSQRGGTQRIDQADLDAEEENIERELDDFDYYPVIAAGVVYYF